MADTTLDAALSSSPSYDCVLIPGGPPAVPANGLLKSDARVMSLLKDQKVGLNPKPSRRSKFKP
jgi:hypothetical protein